MSAHDPRTWITCLGLAWLALAVGCDGSGGGTASAAGSRVHDGPQLALATPESIVVAFRSSVDRVGRIEFGLDPLALDTVVEEPGKSKRHVFELDGLLPSTLYHYQIFTDGKPFGGVRPFRTAPADAAEPVVFAVWGDSGDGSPEQRGIAEQVAAEDVDIVLITGDVVYNNGAPEEISPHYFEPYHDLVDRIVFYPCLGNHDIRTDAGRPLLDALYLPRNGADGTEYFYSFDRGAVHFVALDSNRSLDPGSPQREWLIADLAATSLPWKIVYLHHTVYSSSRHGSNATLQSALAPVVDAHGVDLVLCGHDHDYERTLPMRGGLPVPGPDEVDYRDPAGTVFVVTGGGGRRLYESGHSAFTAASASVFHHCLVRIEGSTLELLAIDRDDEVFDRFSITKSALEP